LGRSGQLAPLDPPHRFLAVVRRGAMTILLGPANADAASIIARADAKGQMTREKIIAANPFLGTFTVADLKS
jgi:hypothetical protein